MEPLLWITAIFIQQTLVVATTIPIVYDDVTEHTFCGPQITTTLSSFCKGRYLSRQDLASNKGTYTPNDDESNENDYSDQQLLIRSEDAYGPIALLHYLNHANQAPVFHHPRARRTPPSDDLSRYVYLVGVADECCRQPCTMRTLLSYCRTPSA